MISVLFLLTAGILTHMSVEGRRCRIKKETIKLEKDIEEMTLLFISDVHHKTINKRLLKRIHAKIDSVIIGGDLLEEKTPRSRVSHNLRQLKKLSSEVFFVCGNHDTKLPRDELKSLLHNNEVTLLENERTTINDAKAILFGTADQSTGRAIVETVNKDEAVNILISHNPVVPRNFKESRQYDLILSGHTHGGQIRLFGYGIRERGGWSQLGNANMLISNGFGTRKLPFRLGAPAEIHIITIKGC